MRTTKTKSPSLFPARFAAMAESEPALAPRSAPADAATVAPPSPLSRRNYRRGPFYLKIDGLTGDRPKYDEFGRLLTPEA